MPSSGGWIRLVTVPPVTEVVVGGTAAALGVRSARSLRWRLLVTVVGVGVGFHYSLQSVLGSLGADSPLAYLGLVPAVAALYGWAEVRPRPGDLSVHDRYLDLMIAVPALLVPVGVLLVLPARLSTFFWLWRIDLLVLPLFVAGAVALLFGTRTLLRCKGAVAYLVLVWPVPVQFLMARWLDTFTSWSIAAVRTVTGLIPIARADQTTPGSFRIGGPAGVFSLLVATECSGANGLLGFLLIAVPTVLVAVGTRGRKVAWLASGAVLIWSLNVVRILLIFAAGSLWGERVAVDGFHPYVGLVTFVLGTAATVWAMPRFGLRFRMAGRERSRSWTEEVVAAVPRWRRSAGWFLLIAALLGVLDAGLREVDPVASALGAARLLPFGSASRRLAQFDTSVVQTEGLATLATRYFGSDATWVRSSLDSTGDPDLGADLSVYADVVTTSDAGTFDDFGIEACYRFHGYDVDGRSEVPLGAGQVGTLLSWKDPRSSVRYTSLYWYWPVAIAGATRYQRVVLLIPSNAGGRVWSPELPRSVVTRLGIAIDERLQGRAAGEPSGRERALRQYLVGVGRALVDASKEADG